MATDKLNANVSSEYRLSTLQQQAKTTGSSDMGKDEFLKLLVAQLQNQDPMSPMENTDYITQLAQFSVVEQAMAQTTAANMSQAYSMIGKFIYAVQRSDDDGAYYEVYGKVDSAGVKDGKPYVMVQDDMVYLENVQQVFDYNAVAGNEGDVTQASAMIGKYISAMIPDLESENGTKEITGMVDKVSVESNGAVKYIYLIVGGYKVQMSEVTEISPSPIELPSDEEDGPNTDETPVTD